MPATSLAEWLRSASDDTLAALLRARRDLATPPPADAGVVAGRACAPGSIARACEDLDTATLAVLETLLVADADSRPTCRSDVAALVRTDVGGALDRLRAKALVWGEDDALRVAPNAREVLGPFPAGLGAPAGAQLTADPAAALEGLHEDERALLDTLAAGPPIGRTRDAAADVSLDRAETPVQRLLARGLLLRRDDQTVELPRELGLALRGGLAFAPEKLAEPELPTNPHTRQGVDEAAAGEAMEFLRHAESLLRAWSGQPPAALKAGGLGIRELRRIARELEVSESQVTLLVELVVEAGLVANPRETAAEWVPTTLADSWLASGPAQRWVTLAEAWLDLPRLPGLAGRRDANDRALVPLGDDLRRPLAPVSRRRVLNALAELPSGAGVKSVDELVSALAWRAPRRGGRLRDETVHWTMAEASALGVVALGALTSAAGALLDGDRHGAASAMADAMPAPVGHVLVQADLTVVAPGPLEPDLEREVAAVADVESAGHATVYRVTEATVRHALDTGRTAGELHELFGRRSATPVPQALTYLIDDVARRHGRLRGGAAASFLRCDDEALLTEVLATEVAREADLRRIAPTVLVSSLPLAEVLDALRGAGFAPAAEGPDGRIMDLRPAGRRIAARSRPARRASAEPGAVGAEALESIIRHIRAGDEAATARRSDRATRSGSDTAATMSLLAEATRERRRVWIGFVDAHGTANQRVVTPVRVGGGVLEGAGDERYPLHRITSAAVVEDS